MRADVSQWEAILATSSQTAFSTYGSDINDALLRSSVAEMKRQIPSPAFVLISGDFLAHKFRRRISNSPPTRARPRTRPSWHQDEFRFAGGGFIHINPSVTPVFGNNPAFQIVEVTRRGDVTDFTAHHLPNVTLPWTRQYSFRDAYAKRRYDRAVLTQLEGRDRERHGHPREVLHLLLVRRPEELRRRLGGGAGVLVRLPGDDVGIRVRAVLLPAAACRRERPGPPSPRASGPRSVRPR